MILLRSSAFALALAGLVCAQGQPITPLTDGEIAAFTPFTYFASAAYCDASTTLKWTCGSNCQANPDFVPVASGGDGRKIQYWYVGYSPSQETVVVGFQGTNPAQLLARLTDENLAMVPLLPEFFPQMPITALIHAGFGIEHIRAASVIFSNVTQTLATYGASTVTVTGHSLGAALALLEGVQLRIQLDASVDVRVIGYGMPRVGNKNFAKWVDSHLGGKVTHINNQRDPIPILPSEFLGYVHPSGEVHIQDSGDWLSCPGQDNPSTDCIVGAVPGVIESNLTNHDGPYNGIVMGCSQEQTKTAHGGQSFLHLPQTGMFKQIFSHFQNIGIF
ncbi:alpha/beta-hydrolase [Lactarius tabidus]